MIKFFIFIRDVADLKGLRLIIQFSVIFIKKALQHCYKAFCGNIQ